MEQKRLWELIALKAAQQADPGELEELRQLLLQYPDAVFTMEAMEAYWPGAREKEQHEEREAALDRHMLKLQKDESNTAELVFIPPEPIHEVVKIVRISPWWKKIAVAASLLLITGITVLYLRTIKEPETGAIALKTISTTNGSKNHFTLPDGSRVWLNAGSTLSYPLSFADDSTRQVTLAGEAYFEITHDEHHPFVIHTEQMDIRDIGTAFNVKAYPNEQSTEATLIEGSIEVKLAKSDKYTVLATPNEKITVVTKNGVAAMQDNASVKPQQLAETDELRLLRTTVVVNPADSLLAETAWLEDKLVFSNESFESLAKKMERWYDVTIQFNSESIKQKRFTGTFSRETVTQALQEIQLIRPFHFSVDKNTIMITE